MIKIVDGYVKFCSAPPSARWALHPLESADDAGVLKAAKAVLAALTPEQIEHARSLYEMYRAREQRDAARWARGERYGPWESFQGNPDNGFWGDEVTTCLAIVGGAGD